MAKIDDLEPKREYNADLSTETIKLLEKEKLEAERQEDRENIKIIVTKLENIEKHTDNMNKNLKGIDEALRDFKEVYKRDCKDKHFFYKINLIFKFIKIIIFNN